MLKSRASRLVFDVVLPLAITLGLTWYFAAGDRDLRIQEAYYDGDSQTSSWPVGDEPFWQAIYDYGPLPGGVIAIAAVVVFVLGFRFAKLGKLRRASIFVFLVAAVSSGIIANLILKEHWGRPRPREVDMFGGRFPFEAVLTMDPVSDGKSFPCGHATMGFFFVAFYFLFRKRRPMWALAGLAVGLGSGILLGITRIVQGGHFASDVVWAGAVVWFSSLGLFYLLKLNRNVLDEPNRVKKQKIPLKVKIFGVFAALVGFTAVMLATPFSEKRDYQIISEVAEDSRLKISLQVIYGELTIVDGNEFKIEGEAWGHGVPTSKIADRFEEDVEEDGTLKLRYLQRWSGKLTEVDQRLLVTIPFDRVGYLKLDLAETIAKVSLPERKNSGCKLDIITEESDIIATLAEGASVVTFAGNESVIEERGGAAVSYFKSVPSSGKNYRLEWKRDEESRLAIERE